MFKQNQNENVSKTMLDCYLVLVTDFYPKNDFTDGKCVFILNFISNLIFN